MSAIGGILGLACCRRRRHDFEWHKRELGEAELMRAGLAAVGVAPFDNTGCRMVGAQLVDAGQSSCAGNRAGL